MTFIAYPWFLVLLPLALLVGFRRLRQRRPALRFSDFRLLEGLPTGRAKLTRWVDAVLHGAALAAVVVAVSGPRLPLPSPIISEGVDIMLVVDVSGSMRETDFVWDDGLISRFEAVQRVFRLFVQGGVGPDGATFAGRPNDQIGLVTFATYPETPAPLTFSHSVLLQLLDAEQPRPLDEAQTNIGDALAEGMQRLEVGGSRRKVVVLLTDGEHNFAGPAGSPTWTPQLAARRAADLGMPIYAIDAGSDAGASLPQNRRAAKDNLQQAARVTGGAYFLARDSAALLDACRQIDQLERRPVESSIYRRYRDIHSWFGLAAIGLMLLAQGWNATWGARMP